MTAPFGPSAELTELSDEYELMAELGRGGSAVVYRARDRALGRDVAIKVVHPRPTAPGDDPVVRLAREARTVAQLQHPNIVCVYAVRRLRSGGLALVMQFVPGCTLKSVVENEGPLAPEQCERILRDVAGALAYAHARGVVHRDVKPENIFLDEDSGRALLADFGIARSADADSMTMTGTAIGTPFYMSPEQVEGGTLDGRSDLYSLGLVAWEMLTGRRPWDGESLYNVIYKQKHEELPPVEALRAGVPLRLQYVVERMLQKRPAARWAGAEGLLAQLSHSVLPGDYGKWQSALRKRVDRWQAEERERAKRSKFAEPAAQSSVGTSTMRFVRRDAAQITAGSAAGTPDAGLGDTMAVPTLAVMTAASGDACPSTEDTGTAGADASGASLPRGPSDAADAAAAHDDALIAAIDGAEPAAPVPVTYDDAEPVWSTGDRWWQSRNRRLVLVAGASLVAVIGAAALRNPEPTSAAATPARSHAAVASRAGTTAGASNHRSTGLDGAEALPSSARRAGPGGIALSHAMDVVALGSRHSCALGKDPGLECWGANERGQLGNASLIGRDRPTRVAGDLTFTRVAAGSAHTCALTRLGDVYCWGADERGQLGDATTVRRTAPVRVAGTGVYRVVRAGGAHSCAISIAGDLACWGANDHGQLGDGTTAARTTPVRVPALANYLVQSVALGAQHSCAVAADGGAWCWGANDNGQLGDGGDTERPAPRPVATADRFTAIAAGLAHSCGITASATVVCWGRNDGGQLGTGDRRRRPAPTLVPFPRPVRPLLVTAGAAHSCVLDADGDAWCWGRNALGQLGDRTRTDRLTPVQVQSARRLAALAAGGTHTCAVTTTRQAVCWGANASGQLGDTTRAQRSTPTSVGPPTVLAVTRPAATRSAATR